MPYPRRAVYVAPPILRETVYKRYDSIVNFLYHEQRHLPMSAIVYKRALAGHPSTESALRDLCTALGYDPGDVGLTFVPLPAVGGRGTRVPAPREARPESRTALLVAHTDALAKLHRHYRSVEQFLLAHQDRLAWSFATYRRAFLGDYVRPSVVEEVLALIRALPEAPAVPLTKRRRGPKRAPRA